MQRHEQPVYVENRQRMQQHIVRRESPRPVERHRIRCEIAMAQHRALRAPGRPARVDDRREIIGAARNGCFERRGTLALRQECLWVGHENARLCIVQEVLNLILGIGRVERQKDRARLQRAKIQHHAFDTLLCLQRHAIAWHHALVDKLTCN